VGLTEETIMHRRIISALLTCSALACGPTPEQDAPRTLQASDFLSARPGDPAVPIPIVLGDSLAAQLTRNTPRHTVSFALPYPARVSLHTQRGQSDGSDVDTMLTLYGLDDEGVRRLVAHNDDDAFGTVFSALALTLQAGRYELEVRGYRVRTRGPFTLVTTCQGAGCPAPAPPCLFGAVFSELRDHARLELLSETQIERADQLVDERERAQLVLAVQQSSHTDVRTPSEALARVDQQRVRRMYLQGHDDARRFTVFEYGVGDSSYGAIFASDALTVLASIHDGDLLDCSVRIE
jgi:hypothetical protein